MKNTRCPYCGKKVSYFSVFAEKTRGEHTCKECGRNSTIFFVSAFKLAILAALIMAIILMCVILFSTFVDDIWGALVVFIPFAVLYLITPIFCRLVPIKRKKKQPKKEENRVFVPKHDSGSTRIIPFVTAEETSEKIPADEKTRVIPKLDNTSDEGFTDISNLKF